VETSNESYLEQREHRRYIVSGVATIESETKKVIGRVVSVGFGGVLIYCDLRAPINSKAHLSFSVSGLGKRHSLVAEAQVVWTQPGKVGMEFTQEPPGLTALLLDLKQRDAMAELCSSP
jgi:hypothetical protein